MKIILLGIPIAQQRHRDRRGGGKYDPQSALKGPLGLFIKSQIHGQKPIAGAISVAMRFHMPILTHHLNVGLNNTVMRCPKKCLAIYEVSLANCQYQMPQ